MSVKINKILNIRYLAENQTFPFLKLTIGDGISELYEVNLNIPMLLSQLNELLFDKTSIVHLSHRQTLAQVDIYKTDAYYKIYNNLPNQHSQQIYVDINSFNLFIDKVEKLHREVLSVVDMQKLVGPPFDFDLIDNQSRYPENFKPKVIKEEE